LLSTFRFPEDPFLIDFTITRTNPDHDPAILDVDDPNHYARTNIQPQLLDPPIYFNPHAAGLTLYSRMDVTIDNQRVDGSETIGEHWFEYNVANRTICSSALRKEKYGEDYKWISNTSERRYVEPVAAVEMETIQVQDRPDEVRPYRPAVPLSRHANLTAAQNVITYDSLGKTASSTIRAGFDGMFPSKYYYYVVEKQRLTSHLLLCSFVPE